MRVVHGWLASALLAALTASSYAADLSQFWPLDAQQRQWNLIARLEKRGPHPSAQMTVENETTGPGQFILWYFNRSDLAPGERDGERFHVCDVAGQEWLFFDGYLRSSPGKALVKHDVVTDRILFTPAGGAPVDLVANGYYAACGGIGQPYLLWSSLPPRYRLQVWGRLTENPRFRWYGDTVVTAPERVVDDCSIPPMQTSAISRQEAAWTTFKDPHGRWGLGSGDTDPQGIPTGLQVAYGRTVWDGGGQIPYLMLKRREAPPGGGWCANRIDSAGGK